MNSCLCTTHTPYTCPWLRNQYLIRQPNRIISLIGWVVLFIAFEIIALSSVCAQSSSKPPEDDKLSTTQEIVVTATRTPEFTSSAPGSPTLLMKDRIDQTPFQQGHQVDDLLRFVPGVQPALLSSRYNHPTAQSVSLRGLGIRRTLVLLDGVPLNDGFGGWINWGLTPDTLQRIEVIPGGTSNVYGNWAMGGVIHLLSEPPRTGTGIRSASQVGNLSTYTQSLSGRYGNDQFGISLGYRWFRTNGFITVPAYQRGPIDQANDSRHQHFNGRIDLKITPRTQLRLRGSLFREDRSFGTPLSLATRTIGTLAGDMHGQTKRGDQWDTTLFAQWQTFRNQTSQITPSPVLRMSEQLDRIQTIPSNDLGGTFQWTAPIGSRHTLVLGTDTRLIIGQSEEEIFSTSGNIQRGLGKGTQFGWGVFAEWIAKITDHVTIIPTLRTDWWKNFNGKIETPQGVSSIPRDNVETAINPKIALRYELTNQITTGMSVYQAFRVPTLNELYRDFSFSGFTFFSNPTLVPERLTGGETNLEIDVLSNRRLILRATAHYNEVKDQIVFVPNSPLSVQRQNIGRTRTFGSELDISIRPWKGLAVTLGYAYADSTIRDFPGNPSLVGKQVPNVSRHQATARATLGNPDLVQLTIMVRYLSQQFTDTLNQQPVADFILLDASLQKNLNNHVRLFVNAENVTDRQYIVTQTGPTKTLGAPLLILGGISLSL